MMLGFTSFTEGQHVNKFVGANFFCRYLCYSTRKQELVDSGGTHRLHDHVYHKHRRIKKNLYISIGIKIHYLIIK